MAWVNLEKYSINRNAFSGEGFSEPSRNDGYVSAGLEDPKARICQISGQYKFKIISQSNDFHGKAFYDYACILLCVYFLYNEVLCLISIQHAQGLISMISVTVAA
jgi:hypothetical protein